MQPRAASIDESVWRYYAALYEQPACFYATALWLLCEGLLVSYAASSVTFFAGRADHGWRSAVLAFLFDVSQKRDKAVRRLSARGARFGLKFGEPN